MSTIVIPQRFGQRYDTVDNWTAKNPVLWAGEIAYGIAAGKVVSTRVGNGSSRWKDLDEAGGGSGVDTSGASDGQVLSYDAATHALKWINPPTAQGAGIHVDNRVATYDDLPAPPSEGAGATYLVDADSRLYVWDGGAWPADGVVSQWEVGLCQVL